jgi:hypothetical protein
MHRKKHIETPEKMMELFLAYKKKVKSNPFVVTDWVGGMAKEVNRHKEKPLTLEGFSTYCFEMGIIHRVHDYFGNKNDAYNNFSDICHAIKEIIRQDQIEGGMAGIYNPSITQRLNNLVDKQETNINIPPMFKD